MRPLLLLLLFVPPPPERDHQDAVAELEAAVKESTTEDQDAAIARLEAALDEVARYPDFAPSDGTVPQASLEARVVLARLYLAQKNEDAARATMDELIRIARDQDPPTRSYGRQISYLYEDRKTTLDGQGEATIEVDCAVPCEVVISERRLDEPREQLLLGSYEVWVRARDPELDAPWEHHEVVLDSADTVATVVYEDPTPEPQPQPQPQPQPEPVKRMLPRGAEIAGMAAGIGLAVAGAVLLSFDNKCSNTKRPPIDGITAEACGDIYESSVGGISMLAVGGGLLVVSGVILSVDEVRVGRAKGRQVMLGARFRF